MSRYAICDTGHFKDEWIVKGYLQQLEEELLLTGNPVRYIISEDGRTHWEKFLVGDDEVSIQCFDSEPQTFYWNEWLCDKDGNLI